MANFNVDMQYLHDRKSITPYEYLSVDHTKELSNGDTYRIVVYGAYNAMGLIGTEKNGIAILDNQQMAVLCDEICPVNSGYNTPTTDQINMVSTLIDMNDEDFKEFINSNPRSRYSI